MAINTEVKDQEKFQDLYTIFVSQGIKLAKTMLQRIQKTPDSIASAILAIVTRLEESGVKNGLAFDLPVVFHGSKEILIYIISQLGIQADEQFVKQTVGIMVGKYLDRAIASGKMSKDDAIQLATQMKSQAGQMQPQGQQQAPPQGGGIPQPGPAPQQGPPQGLISQKMGAM